MFKKIAIGSLILITGAVISAFATNYFTAGKSESTPIPVEQVSSESAVPEHCQPSDCSPEKAANCPYDKTTSATSAVASEKTDCPATKECPPSKCNTEKSSGKVTL